jgi:hypothetical protein
MSNQEPLIKKTKKAGGKKA